MQTLSMLFRYCCLILGKNYLLLYFCCFVWVLFFGGEEGVELGRERRPVRNVILLLK